MSQLHSLVVTLVNPDSAGEDLLLLQLEQEEWAPYTGFVTKSNMVRQIGKMLFADHGWNPVVGCALMNGLLYSLIYAYPLLPTTKFKVLSSYGYLSEGSGQDVVMEETIDFDFDVEQGLKYPAIAVSGYDWLTSYDHNGNPDTRPAVSVLGRNVTSSSPVYGTLRIRYSVYRVVYTLSMEAREDAIEHFWSAYLLGLPEGGRPVLLEFDPPPTMEDMTKEGLTCGDENLEVTRDEPDPEDMIGQGIKIEIYDYCSGELITTQ